MKHQNSKTISIFPLDIEWPENAFPICKVLPAHQLRQFLNQYFVERNKNIRVRELIYQEQDRYPKKSSQNQDNGNIVSSTLENGQVIKEQKRRPYCEEVGKSNLTFFKNANALIEIYLYNRPNVHLAETKQIMHRFPTYAKIKAFVEMAREQYNTLDDFKINVDQNPIILRHPSTHKEYKKVERKREEVNNWTISFEPASQVLSHFLEFRFVNQISTKVNPKLNLKSYILYKNSSQFQLVSQIFNGIALKFVIPKNNVKFCRLFESDNCDMFYFSFVEQPAFFGLHLDWKVGKDIEYQQSWLPYQPFLSNSKYFSFRNHSVFRQYFHNSNVISIQTQKLSETSIYLRSFCYGIKQRFYLMKEGMKDIHLLTLLSKINNNYYSQVIGNTFISTEFKFQLINIFRTILINGQLSMLETLQLMKIQTFGVNVETYRLILEMMIRSGGQGLEWVKTVYDQATKPDYSYPYDYDPSHIPNHS